MKYVNLGRFSPFMWFIPGNNTEGDFTCSLPVTAGINFYQTDFR